MVKLISKNTLTNAIFVLAYMQLVYHIVVPEPPSCRVTGLHEDGSGQLS